MAGDRWVGETLGGRYQIEELLGQGGMSAVYKARDPNLQRTVAIKLIHPHLSGSEEFIRRFESEATGIARLRHPNIVQVYDFNHDGDVYYMVLEFVAGETLQNRLKRLKEAGRRIPTADALHFLRDVCLAADYAHQRGLIHRDIKPANVMLSTSGEAVLMDFGIARILDSQQHTATGAVLGTALYMSPEQIKGLHPDARSDIYSIGVTLFEALGGRPPFEADSAMTLMMMHLNDPVPDLEQLNPGLPEAVRAIVYRALEKEPGRRYQTAAEMAAALDQARAQLGPAAAQPIFKPAPPAETVIEAPAPTPPPGPPVSATPVSVTPVSATPVSATPPPTSAPAAAQTPAPLSATPAAQTVVEARPPAPVPTPAPAPASAPAAPRSPALKWILLAGGALILLLVLAGGAAGAFILLRPHAPTLTPLAALEASPTPAAAESPAPSDTPEAAETPTSEEASPTPEEATPTAEPETATPAAAALPLLGGADQIAFVRANDIWTANVDGSALQQITKDGSAKQYLRWLPGGDGFSFISGKCIRTADLQGALKTVTCFNNASFVDSFEPSPDGSRVALSVDHQLYLLPFDLDRLSRASNHAALAALGECANFAPYARNAATSARWSKDGKTLAAIVIGVLSNGQRGDLVDVFAVDECIANPMIQVQFPEPHFTFGDYNRDPTLTSFAWDGEALFAMNANARNQGFGNLELFNRESFTATNAVNPIEGKCCYRGATFSPDGQYLLFAFQDQTAGASSQTNLYYVPYGSLGTSASYDPLPIPPFTNPLEDPQAVLRPAR